MDDSRPLLPALLVGIPVLAMVVFIAGELINWPVPAPIYVLVSHAAGLLLLSFTWQARQPIGNHLSSERLNTLHESYEQFTTLYENSPVPYLTLTPDGNIKFYNLAAVRLFQTTKDALIDRSFVSFLRSDDEERLSLLLGKLQVGSSVTDVEMQIETEAGGLRWVRLSVFTHQHSRQRLVALVDITEQKRVDTAKSEFVALATHQLRTPIAAIRWNLELMERKLRDVPEEPHRKYLDKIYRNVDRMIALISDFLSVSKLETGTFSANAERIELQQYFTDIVDEYEPDLTKKQIGLELSTQPEDAAITADTRLFHIVTSNLLSNAVKYTPEGGRVTFGYQVVENELVITVADSGIGIPADEQGALFEKFFRASNAQKHQSGGTGLGLYIVKESVKQLGGTISVASSEGEGTTFTVQIPY